MRHAQICWTLSKFIITRIHCKSISVKFTEGTQYEMILNIREVTLINAFLKKGLTYNDENIICEFHLNCLKRFVNYHQFYQNFKPVSQLEVCNTSHCIVMHSTLNHICTVYCSYIYTCIFLLDFKPYLRAKYRHISHCMHIKCDINYSRAAVYLNAQPLTS